MQVRTQSVNLCGVCDSRSESIYEPQRGQPHWTKYSLVVETKAFQGNKENQQASSEALTASPGERTVSTGSWGSIGR